MTKSNKQYIVVKSQYVLHILQYLAILFWHIITALLPSLITVSSVGGSLIPKVWSGEQQRLLLDWFTDKVCVAWHLCGCWFFHGHKMCYIEYGNYLSASSCQRRLFVSEAYLPLSPPLQVEIL